MSPLPVLPLPIKSYSITAFAIGTVLLLTILLFSRFFQSASGILCFATAMFMAWYAGLKSTEKELQTERDIISKVIDLAACLIVVLDKEGRIIRFNQTCEKTTGYLFAEVKHKFVWDLFLIPEELKPVKTIFTKLYTENHVSQYTNYWLTINGEKRLINWSSTVIVDDNGLVEYVIATGTDITDCQKAEIALTLSYSDLETRVKQRTAELTIAQEALQAQEELFRSLSSYSPVGIFMADIQGYYTYTNPRCQDIYGMSFVEILGDSWQNYIHPEDRELVLTQWQDYTRECGEYAMEYRLQLSDGIVRWVNVSCSPMFSDSGELIGHVGTVRDVTESQQAQAALSGREQELRTLLENTPDIIIRIDQELRYVYVNQAVERAQGQPVSFFIGKTSQEIGVPPEVCELWDETLHKVLETGQEEIIEFQSQSVNGIRTYQSRVVPEFDTVGAIEYALIVARDITELKLAEVQKVQLTIEQTAREKAEIEQQRSRFLAEVSKMLATSFDGETVWQNVAQLAVESAAEGCYIHLIEFDGKVSLVAVAHAEASMLDAMNKLTVIKPIDNNCVNGYPLVLCTGKSELITEVNEEILAAAAENEAELEVLRSLNIASHACVPMTARGRVIGAISCFTSKSGRRYNSEDLAMLEDLAYHVAIALDNARLYTEAQEALAQTSQSFALIDSLLEASPLGICFLDREMRYIRINRVLAELNGFPAEQHLGQDFRQLLPESAAKFAPLIQQVLETSQPLLNVEMSGESGGIPGYFGHWLVNYYPVKNQGEQTIGVGIILTDITIAKQTEMALIESEKTLEILIQACPLAITVFSAESGVVKMWNPAAEKMFGWNESEAIGQFLPSISPDEQEGFTVNLRRIRDGNAIAGMETQRHRKDGSSIDIGLWATPVRDHKGNINCMSIIADISDRKQVEAERAQLLDREQAARAEAEASNQLKDEFLATLSHELRTPLNAILGWAQVLRRGRYTPATLDTALEAIERQARVQTLLVEDLLDVSRIIQGKLSLKTGWLDIIKTIEIEINSVRLIAEAKSITVNSQLDPTLGLIWGDVHRLQQIVSNLLTNAVKFTSSGGTVELRLSKNVGFLSADSPLPVTNYLQIQVSDTGKGITADFLPHVFDRFRQADGSTTRTDSGLGLGLAIVRHLVELHGGNVTAESPGQDQGATFTVKLPLKQPKSQSTLDFRL